MGHLYNIQWGNEKFAPHANKFSYRSVVIKNSIKVLDEIKTVWALNQEIAQKVINSWNGSGRNRSTPPDIEYIYCLVPNL